jgi:hypothetical protein
MASTLNTLEKTPAEIETCSILVTFPVLIKILKQAVQSANTVL